jgi:Cu(I)/Ag(I) efflux system membrane fusion protein
MNPQTRTVKIRSDFSSQNNKLKPQMYGQTVFFAEAGEGLLVPADAIIFAGNRNVVWVKTTDGMFEARKVEVGQKYGDKYQILSGLSEGDEVAASGGFLIDSESQLKTGMPTGHQHDNTISNQKNVNQNESGSTEHNNH